MKLQLGDLVMDNLAGRWTVVQETRHMDSPLLLRCILMSITGKSAICRNDGTQFISHDSKATHIDSVINSSKNSLVSKDSSVSKE